MVARSDSGAKNIIESADCTFGGIAVVGVWGERIGSQRCAFRRIFALCGSTCCQGCGEWGMDHAGVGVLGMYSRM